MSIIDTNIELSEAVRFALTRKADPAVLKHIEEESARIREELRRRHGLTNVAVDLIREVRDE
ncbi:MAG: hypothetical protein ABSA77_10235 [Thermoguttaceae bacterium]|jgi:hypothetical protein